MPSPELEAEVVTDLLRSAWIVEAARAEVFSEWAPVDGRFDRVSTLARSRADIVGADLATRGRPLDHDLVEPHARWMTVCVPGPQETFADLFLARLGGWVEAHAAPYLDDGAGRLLALGEEERQELVFPDAVPPAPAFQPLAPPPTPVATQRRLRVGVLGDLHIGSPSGEAMARAAVADLNAAAPDFVIQLGDLTDRGEEAEFELAAALLSDLAVPHAAIIGNHDAYSMSEGRLAGRERFARWFEREPDGLLIERSGIRLALLDSVEHGVSPFPPYDLITGAFIDAPGGAIVRGALTAPQHELLAEIASPGSPPTLVFLHHPPQPFTGFPPVIFGLRDADSGRLHATCDSGNVWGVFAGHTHRNHRGAGFDGVPVQEVGVPRDFPFGYGIIDVAERGYHYRFHQISDRDLLREAAAHVGAIQRRYSVGRDDERAYTWTCGEAGRR